MATEDSSKRIASMLVDGVGEDGPMLSEGEEPMMEEEVSEGETVAAAELMDAIAANDAVSFARALKSFLAMA